MIELVIATAAVIGAAIIAEPHSFKQYARQRARSWKR